MMRSVIFGAGMNAAQISLLRNGRETHDGRGEYDRGRLCRGGCRLRRLRHGRAAVARMPPTKSCCWKPAARTTNFWIHVPLGFGKTFADPKVNWMFRNGTRPGARRSPNVLAARQGPWADLRRSTEWSTSAASTRTLTTGASLAIPAGHPPTCCHISSDPRPDRGEDDYHGGDGPLAVSDVTLYPSDLRRVHRSRRRTWLSAQQRLQWRKCRKALAISRPRPGTASVGRLRLVISNPP